MNVSRVNCVKCGKYLIGVTLDNNVPISIETVQHVALHVEDDDVCTIECPDCGEFTPQLPLVRDAIKKLRSNRPAGFH